MEYSKEKQEIADRVADILELVVFWLRRGKCNHLSMSDLEQMKSGAAMMLDVDIDYNQAKEMTGKTYSALLSGMSRNSVEKPIKKSIFKISTLFKAFPLSLK